MECQVLSSSPVGLHTMLLACVLAGTQACFVRVHGRCCPNADLHVLLLPGSCHHSL